MYVRSDLILNQEVKLLHVEIFTITEAPGAVTLVAVHAEEAVFVACNHCTTSLTFHRLVTLVRTNHPLTCFELGTLFVSIDTVLSQAESEAFL